MVGAVPSNVPYLGLRVAQFRLELPRGPEGAPACKRVMALCMCGTGAGLICSMRGLIYSHRCPQARARRGHPAEVLAGSSCRLWPFVMHGAFAVGPRGADDSLELSGPLAPPVVPGKVSC